MRRDILPKFVGILLMLLQMCCMDVQAQQMLYGHIVDKTDGTYLQSVTVELLRTDSTLIGRTVTGENGSYGFPSPGKGIYLIHCTALGYTPVYQRQEITVSKRVNQIEAKLIRMAPEARMLDSVKVVATKIKMILRGDTVIYNADAFQLSEGSMLNALVEQLPGITLKDNGQIYINGRFVSSLMLNGRDFFKGNPLVALENLPAYTVKQVKVYDKAGEASQLLGRDAGDKALVMDVHLKKEYNEGYIANADNGYGSNDRYRSQLFGMRFTKLSRFSIFTNINNVNNKHRPGSNGEWKSDENPIGRQKNWSAGAEYSYESKQHDWGVTLTPTFSKSDDDNRTWTSAQTYLNSGDLFQRSTSASLSKVTSVLSRNRLWKRKGKWSGSLNLNLDYQKNHRDGLLRSATFMEDPLLSTDVLDSLEGDWHNTSILDKTYDFLRDATLGYGERYKLDANTRHSFNVKGDLLTLEGSYVYNKNYNRQFSLYQLTSYVGQNESRQHTFLQEDNHGYEAKVDARYLLYLKGDFNSHLMFHYSFKEQSKDASSPFYRLDRDEAQKDEISWLPSSRDKLLLLMDQANSYGYSQHDYTHIFESQFRYSWKKPNGKVIILTLEMPVEYRNNMLDYTRVEHYGVNRKKCFLNPGITISSDLFTMDKMVFAVVGMNLSHGMPQLEDLVPYEDSRDPHHILQGNPLLANSQTLKAFASYSRRLSNHRQHFAANLTFTNVQGAVAYALLFNNTNGLQTIRPYNVYGNWNLRLNLDAGRAIAMQDRLTIENKLEANYLHSVDLNSLAGKEPQRSPVNNFNLKDVLNLSCSVSSSLKVGLTASGTYDYVSSGIHSFDSYHVENYSYGCNALWDLPLSFQLSTDFKVSCNRGYSDAAMNRDEYVWNARLSKGILKGKLVLMLDSFDLLGQLKNRRYVLNSQGRVETYTNTIPRYVMLHVAYKFNKNPKKK